MQGFLGAEPRYQFDEHKVGAATEDSRLEDDGYYRPVRCQGIKIDWWGVDYAQLPESVLVVVFT
jgi:hypothetical protein